MRRARLLFLLLALAGCFHARKVEKKDEPAQPDTVQGGTRPAPPARPGQPPVSHAPSALLDPAAVGRIQQALVDKGLLGRDEHERGEMNDATSAALRRFQKEQDLAQTGAPDRETVRRLGLDPEQIYKEAPPSARPRTDIGSKAEEAGGKAEEAGEKVEGRR